MVLEMDIQKRAGAQRTRIIQALRDAGINGLTNIYLYDHITKSLGARLSELYEVGYIIQCTSSENGVYQYILIAEPIKPFSKPLRAEELLLNEIEQNYKGYISTKDLQNLLKKHDLIISRKAGAHKRKNAKMGVSNIENKSTDCVQMNLF